MDDDADAWAPFAMSGLLITQPSANISYSQAEWCVAWMNDQNIAFASARGRTNRSCDSAPVLGDEASCDHAARFDIMYSCGVSSKLDDTAFIDATCMPRRRVALGLLEDDSTSVLTYRSSLRP